MIAALLVGLCLAACGGSRAAAGGGDPGGAGAAAPASVLQHHKDASRDGLYIDPSFTRTAAARMYRDGTFNAPLQGPTYAQPLFWARTSPTDRDLLLVVTEQNQVYAFDASSGAQVWRRSVGTPVPSARLPCGNIDPLGITGTPIIDAASRTLFLGALTTPDGGATKRHLVIGLSVADGSTRPGWPVDVSATVRAGSLVFDSAVQNQRGALALLGRTVYVPYGGHFGDCGHYRGWVVGVPIDQPSSPKAWVTPASGGGIWAPGGIASDGKALYVATGNTFNAQTWGGGEAIIRLDPAPSFSREPRDYFAPTNWRSLDASDTDLGGSGPVLVSIPGGKWSQLIVALGKDGEAYLIDPANMGGVGPPVARRRVSRDPIINAAAAYTTARGAYVVFRGRGIDCPEGQSGDLTAIRIGASSPPSLAVAWCANQKGGGSPVVTTTDGRSEAIVWSVGAQGDNRLHGFDGETGQVLFDGGGSRDAMSPVRRYQTPIVAKGRIFVAADDRLYAFALSPGR